MSLAYGMKSSNPFILPAHEGWPSGEFPYFDMFSLSREGCRREDV